MIRRILIWWNKSISFKVISYIFLQMKIGITEQLILYVNELKKTCHSYLCYSFFFISGARLAESKNVRRKHIQRNQALPATVSICKKCLFIKNIHLYFPNKTSSKKQYYLHMHSMLFSSATNPDTLVEGVTAYPFLPFVSFGFILQHIHMQMQIFLFLINM